MYDDQNLSSSKSTTLTKQDYIKKIGKVIWEELYSSKFSRCEGSSLKEVKNIARVDKKLKQIKDLLDKKIFFSPEDVPPPSVDLDYIDKTITIVLDFDETLIHVGLSSVETSSASSSSSDQDYEGDTFTETKEKKDIFVIKPFADGKWSYFLRPGTQEFLKRLKDLGPNIEIIAWTAATKVHAERVLFLIDPGMNIVDFCIVRSDKWFKDGTPGKDLSRLLYRCPYRMLIVDDSPVVKNFNQKYNNYITVPSFSPDGDFPLYFESFKRDTVLMTLYDAIERGYTIIKILEEASKSCCYEQIKSTVKSMINGYKDYCYFSKSIYRSSEENNLIQNPIASYHDRYDVYVRNFGCGKNPKACCEQKIRISSSYFSYPVSYFTSPVESVEVSFADAVKCHPLIINVEMVPKKILQNQTDPSSSYSPIPNLSKFVFLQKIQNAFSSSQGSSTPLPEAPLSSHCLDPIDFIIDVSSPKFEILSTQILNVFVIPFSEEEINKKDGEDEKTQTISTSLLQEDRVLSD